MGSSTIYKKDGDEGKVDRRSCVGNWCISTLEQYRVNKLTIPQLRDSVVPPCRFSTLKTVPSPPRELKFRVPFVAIKRHCNVSSLFPPFPLATGHQFRRNVPGLREIVALSRFDGVDAAAVVGSEEATRPVGSIHENQPPAVRCQLRISVDKLLLGDIQVLGNCRDLCVIHADKALPSAARTAAGTVEFSMTRFHLRRDSIVPEFSQDAG